MLYHLLITLNTLVEIDSKLNFKTHISKVQSKISKGVGILYKLNKLLPTRTLITLHYALIFPHLMYGIIIWGSIYLTSLQTLQHKAIRAIAKLKSKDRVIPIYKQYNLLKTNDIYRLEIAKFMHHFQTKSLPFIFTDYFMYLKDCHHHKTRISNCTNFFLLYYLSSQLQCCIKYSGVRLWNCIPENIKKLAHKNFLVAYKKVLTDQYK